MNLKEKEILIVVKTYPNISSKYQEVVCTAGICREGNWYRLYPIPFKSIKDKYKKYDVISVSLFKDKQDSRRESHKVDYNTIKVLKNINTENNWSKRNDYVNKTTLYFNKKEIIIYNTQGNFSICRFKPSKVLEVIAEKVSNTYSYNQLKSLQKNKMQFDMFIEKKDYKAFTNMPKLPYKFSYCFLDNNNEESTLMIEDWEIGQLYWNCFNKTGSEEDACNQVKEKYMNIATSRDLQLFLGTTKKFDKWASNPFVIIGVYYPPIIVQPNLL